MMLLLGFCAAAAGLLGLILALLGRGHQLLSFASLSLTALTVCAFYQNASDEVLAQDWSALMDVLPTVSGILWICVLASILINGISLFLKK